MYQAQYYFIVQKLFEALPVSVEAHEKDGKTDRGLICFNFLNS